MSLCHRYLFSASMLHTLQGLRWITYFLDTAAVISSNMGPSSQKNATRRLILSLWQNFLLIRILFFKAGMAPKTDLKWTWLQSEINFWQIINSKINKIIQDHVGIFFYIKKVFNFYVNEMKWENCQCGVLLITILGLYYLAFWLWLSRLFLNCRVIGYCCCVSDQRHCWLFWLYVFSKSDFVFIYLFLC